MTRSADYVRRHQETSTTGKWDTGGYSGDQIRAAVAAYIEGDDMPLTDDDAQRVAKAVWNLLVNDNPTGTSIPAQQLLRAIRNDTNALRKGGADE